MTTIDGALGATWDGEGTHFRVFSGQAHAVELCLFDEQGHEHRVPMASEPGFLWYVYVPGVGPGQAYGFRVHGPYEPARGVRCNPAKVLTDPYAKAISRQESWGQEMFGYPIGGDENARDDRDNAATAPRSFVIDPSFDWTGDAAPAHAPSKTVLYELHVKGYTRLHPAVPEPLRGTYAGLATPAVLDDLRRLGVTAVELMPVHHFAHEQHQLDAGLCNYWGYHTFGYFAPHAEYAADDRGGQVREFKAMVKAMHAAGLEVILDVVYNHTAEGNHLGPTLSFKGFDNPAYYHLVQDDPRYYMDYTGTGNSVNLRHPYVLQLVMDSLRYWVTEMHVDGFRFDLAATLARGVHTVDTWSAFFCTIHQDPVLQRVKLIAEPWDTGDNGYLVGNFPFHWSEWNDRYRETVRRFWREEPSVLPELATRLMGSADLFQGDGRGPSASINYIASHDGLTLRDLAEVSPVLEGIESGPARDEARRRLQRNLLATVLLSMGTPMIGQGDEWGRSQGGHDNAFDQDNETSWLDWSRADGALAEFVRRLIALRGQLPWVRHDRWPRHGLDVRWIRPDGESLGDDDWNTPRAHVALDATLDGDRARLMLNAGNDPVSYLLPEDEGRWELAVDTAAEAPAEVRPVHGSVEVQPHALVLVFRRAGGASA